jgi:hypothetical protein
MRNLLLVFICVLLFSCNSKKIEGVYYFEKDKNKHANFFDIGGAAEIGRDMACEMIGQFEFKNGKCYMNILGVEQRVDYEIEDSVIYLGSNPLSNAGIGLRIIDENTLLYAGGIFRKRDKLDNKESQMNISVENEKGNERQNSEVLKTKQQNSNNLLVKNSENTSESKFVLIKDVYSKDGDIYLVLDFVEIIDDYGRYKNTSTKLRTFKIGDSCEIQNCITESELSIDNILDFKNEIISTSNHEQMISCFIENGVITIINIGCWG